MARSAGAAVGFGAIAGVLIGSAAALQQEALLAPITAKAGLVAGCAALLAVLIRLVRPAVLAPVARGWALLAFSALVALAWVAVDARTRARLAEQLSEHLGVVGLRVEGRVSSLPVARVDGVRFQFEVERAWHGEQTLAIGAEVPPRVALGWYVGFPGSRPSPPPPAELGAGKRWQWVARPRRLHGLVNPHGPDIEPAYFEQGLRATGQVRPLASSPQRLADAPWVVSGSLAPVGAAGDCRSSRR